MHKDVHIVTTLEARYASGELDTREVLFFADNFKLFATFSPEGSVELLRVNLAASNKNESIYLPVGFMTALAAEAASYQADIQQERAHQAFIKARQSAEAMTEAAEHAEQLPDLEAEDPAIYGLVPHLHCDQEGCAGAVAYNDETHTDAHCVVCGHPWKRIPATISFSKE